MTTKNTEKAKEFEFKTEVNSLLKLLANSLYSNSEIFLRELISNSADSLSKLRYLSLTNKEVLGKDEILQINIEIDEKEKTFSISDNGLGMTDKELINNLGTIAQSGTLNFLKNHNANKKENIDLIGQFGVGFYSIFMVTDEVTVLTSSRLHPQGWEWKTDGQGKFTIKKHPQVNVGTKIIFKLKESAHDLASQWRLEQIIKQHSNFVPFKITVNDKEVNSFNAPWTKNKKSVTKNEYIDLYKYLQHQQQEPLFTYHYHSEAPLQFDAVLFVGQHMDNMVLRQQVESQVKLYSKRVFISDNVPNLLPSWLRFIVGIVDSQDLPLNVSRQTIQDNPVIIKIQKFLVKKLVGEWANIKKSDVEKFKQFWQNYGVFIKEGIYGSFEYRDLLIPLYHAHSSANAEQITSLQEYVDRMPESQKEIYYIHGKNQAAIENSPHLEYFKHNNIEVLYLYDDIDDFVITSIGTFADKQIKRADSLDVNIEDKDTKLNEDQSTTDQTKTDKLLNYFKDILGDSVEDVISSQRVIDSPCMLVSKQGAPSAQMEKILKVMDKEYKQNKKTLAINSHHPIIKNLRLIHGKKPQDPIIKEAIEIMYDSCVLHENSQQNTEYSKRVYGLLDKASYLHNLFLENQPSKSEM